MKKFLICEAGLHGDGDMQYYLCLIRALRGVWSGWPPIVFKVQHWCDPDSPWAKRVNEIHGRPPLKSVSTNELFEIGIEAREAGFGYSVTFHDELGILDAFDGGIIFPVTHLKLGSFDFASAKMRGIAYELCSKHNMGLVASVFGVSDPELELIMSNDVPPEGTIFLLGESRYPANSLMPKKNEHIDGYAFGYSAHNVPSLAENYVIDALHHSAKVIELHVTQRPYSMRPLPGDMCVSLDIDMFSKIALRCGETWAN